MMEISLDAAREALIDHIHELVAYRCESCGAEFYFEDDTAKLCPKCGFLAKPAYERDVELLDWGIRKGDA
jgi:rubrerythrin